MKIRIGTRKSKLAMAQTMLVADALMKYDSSIEIELVPISTEGDIRLDKSLSLIGGKGVFVSEIESQLYKENIDIAVHSAKDLPVVIDDRLEISGVLPRADYRDVLVVSNEFLKNGTIDKNTKMTIGTGSIRRRVNMHRNFPKMEFKDIRGNIDTRLRKLDNGEYDGIILAAAGIERLHLDMSKYRLISFDFKDFLPAPCQGIIAIECLKNNSVRNIVRNISDKKTQYCFETERKVIELLNGDCSMPVGAFSYINDDEINLTISDDSINFRTGKSKIDKRFELAKKLVESL